MSQWRVRYSYGGSPTSNVDGDERAIPPAWFVFEGTQTEFFQMLAKQFANEHPTFEMFEMHITGPRSYIKPL